MSEYMSKNELLTARYGEESRPEKVIWNEQIAGILNHRSIRQFSSQPLPEGWFETLVAAAQSASTSSNLQQWSVVAVTDPDIKSQVHKLSSGENGQANPYIDEAPAILLWVADLSRSESMAKESGTDTTVLEYMDSFVMATVDAALASQNAVVAAESIGLGTVYIGATRNKAKELADLIKLPSYSYVVCGLVVGWPKPDVPTDLRPRLPQQVVAYHNRYESSDLNTHIENYEKVFHAFREGLGMKDKTWRSSVEASASSIEYMDGRQNLRGTLEARKFGFK